MRTGELPRSARTKLHMGVEIPCPTGVVYCWGNPGEFNRIATSYGYTWEEADEIVSAVGDPATATHVETMEMPDMDEAVTRLAGGQ